MVFYQAVLLAGYAYAHVTTRWLGARRQAGLHLLILLVPLLALPIALPAGWIPPGDTSPIPWLLALLAAAVGLPFFAVSATSPVLQAWFAATGHPAARDPYVLYAASNVGSLLALLAYPVLVERFVHLDSQSRLWAWGYGILVVLAAGCALALWRAGSANRGGGARERGDDGPARRRRAGRRRPADHPWPTRSLGPPRGRPVQPDAQRDDLPLHRHRGDPAALDRAARDLSPDVRPRVRPATAHPTPRLGRSPARGPAPPGAGARRPGERAPPAGHPHAPRGLLRRRDGLPRRARPGPARPAPPDDLLPVALRRRCGRGRVHRAGRAARLHERPGVPARPGAAPAPAIAATVRLAGAHPPGARRRCFRSRWASSPSR